MILDLNQLLTFLLVFGFLTISVGPDTILIIRNVMWNDASDGVVTAIGACTGCFAHATLSAVGVSAILLQSAALFQGVKTLGALYLAWLGLQALRRAAFPKKITATDSASKPIKGANRGWKICFREGLISNLLNPKTALFYLSILPQFIYPGESALLKSLFLATIHFFMAVAWLSSVALLVGKIHTALKSTTVQGWLNGLSGVTLILMAVRFLLEKRTVQI